MQKFTAKSLSTTARTALRLLHIVVGVYWYGNGWGAINFMVRCELVQIEGHLKDTNDTWLKFCVLMPFHLAARGLIFEQDNARPHVALTSQLLTDNVWTILCPAMTSDINSIEPSIWDEFDYWLCHRDVTKASLRLLSLALRKEWAHKKIQQLIGSLSRFPFW